MGTVPSTLWKELPPSLMELSPLEMTARERGCACFKLLSFESESP